VVFVNISVTEQEEEITGNISTGEPPNDEAVS